jgi:hypothetical protein
MAAAASDLLSIKSTVTEDKTGSEIDGVFVPFLVHEQHIKINTKA